MTLSQCLQYRAYRHQGGTVSIAASEANWNQLTRKHEHAVLIRPRYTGVCSADIRELRGERPGRSDFGHEVVGTVMVSTHRQFAAGQCVVLNPFVKIERETGFAEMMYLGGSEQDIAMALLPSPSAEMKFSIAEPLACVIHAAGRSACEMRQPTLVLGAGFFGLLLYCYLECKGIPVSLANRNNDRVIELSNRIPWLRIVGDLAQCQGRFASVFMMQARIELADVTTAATLIREEGEVILFGAVERRDAPDLYAARNGQRRVPYADRGHRLYLQGTLDASTADLQEAIATLARSDFAQMIAPIFAEPLSFEEGAIHLTWRARSPRSFRKYVVELEGRAD